MTPPKKQYQNAESYEKKLERVMERFGTSEFDFDFSRRSAWVQFKLRGKWYRFEHSLEKAEKSPQPLTYGSDCFAQIVLALEDLARMAERGIYELTTWLAGLQFLPPAKEVPDCLKVLGFSVDEPVSLEDIDARYKALAKKGHPDHGGTNEEFIKLQNAVEEAKKILELRG